MEPVQEKLPPGVISVAPEIGFKNLPPKYMEKYLRKTVPQKALQQSTMTVMSFKLEPTVSKVEKKRHSGKKFNLKRETKKSIFKIPKDGLKFKEFYPIHLMWKQYMDQLIGQITDQDQLHMKLMRADYHGCYLVVAFSNCPTVLGQRGLVVQETRNTFKLLTHKDKIVIIPKKKNIFAFDFNNKLIKIYGTNFCYQSAERMKVKFKPKPLEKL